MTNPTEVNISEFYYNTEGFSPSKYWFGVLGLEPSRSSKSSVSKELCASVFIVRWTGVRMIEYDAYWVKNVKSE